MVEIHRWLLHFPVLTVAVWLIFGSSSIAEQADGGAAHTLDEPPARKPIALPGLRT